jgi:NAD(P)-dependent dehydrogenase (short-subunit alcohol dehydrogenase family)
VVDSIGTGVPPATILIIGGAGAFGLRLTKALLATTACRVVVAGRSDRHRSIVAALVRLYGPLRIGAATFDRADAGPAIQAPGPFCVIDAAGPFQGAEPCVAKAAIAAGCHYVDIADARDFVAAFPELDAAARTAGVLAVAGASSTPALSHAVVDDITRGWRMVDAVEITISPGNRAPRGPAVLKAILSYVGRPVRLWRNGAWTTRPGWSELVRRDMPGLGRRWLSLCETPDLDLVPTRFPTVQTAIFRAGLELSALHLGLYVLMQAVRLGWLQSLSSFAYPLGRVADSLAAFGSDRGGMSVSATGVDGSGVAVEAEWSLVAEAGDGPNVPVLPALAIVRALLANDLTVRGAMPAVGLIDLAAIEAEFHRFAITTRQERRQRNVGMFASALGARMDVMPALIRDIHDGLRTRLLRGRADVSGASHVAGRLVARAFGLTRQQGALIATVTLVPQEGEEIWSRRFGRTTFRSRLRADARPGRLTEQFGPFVILLRIAAHEEGFDLTVVGWRLGPLPRPAILAPRSKARAFVDDDGCYRFDVAVTLPLIGALVHYRGWLVAEP